MLYLVLVTFVALLTLANYIHNCAVIHKYDYSLSLHYALDFSCLGVSLHRKHRACRAQEVMVGCISLIPPVLFEAALNWLHPAISWDCTACRELLKHPAVVAGKAVLEIGSGCGLCGILAAKLGAAQVGTACQNCQPVSMLLCQRTLTMRMSRSK